MIDSPLIELTDEQQVLADDVIDAMGDRAHLTDHPALAILLAALDDDGSPVANCANSGGVVNAPTLDEVVMQTWGGGGYLVEPTDSDEVILAALRGTTEAALAGDESFWGGGETSGPIVGTIKSSDGRTRMLVLDLIDYLTGPYHWYGVFADRTAVEKYLIRTGHVVRIEQFDKISRKRLLAKWRSYNLT